MRLEHFRAQQELARNFYDDQEFCPLTRIEEVYIYTLLYASVSRINQHTFYLNFSLCSAIRLPNIEKESRSVHRRSLRQIILSQHLLAIIPLQFNRNPINTITHKAHNQDLVVPIVLLVTEQSLLLTQAI